MSSFLPYLWTWLAVGVVTLLLETHSPLRQWLRDRQDPGFMALLEELDPRSKTRWYRIRVRVLAPALAAVAMVLLWPSVPWLRFRRWQSFRRLKRQSEARVFRVRQDHLRERMGVAQIERREWVEDPLGAVPSLPFGHLHGAWLELKANLQPGDELWSFSARWDDNLGKPHLREGYALWRRGRPVGWVLSLYQPLEEPAGPVGH